MSIEQTESVPWYVVHTKPHKELLVAGMLEDTFTLPIYLPEVLQPYRGQMTLRPLFPRYLFVQADLDIVEATAINSTPGALRMVTFGDRPLPLRGGTVEQIRLEVERLNAEGGLPLDTFRSGDMVRLKSGPLQGLHAVFVRYLRPAERAVVLLKFLGQQNEIVLDLADIERASSIQFKRRRGTRGGGRKINYGTKSAPERDNGG